MKKVLFSLFISSVLLLVGCQENSITNPVSSDSINKASSVHETILRGTVILDQQLVNPTIKGNPDFKMKGKINYIETIFPKNVPELTGVGSNMTPGVEIGLNFSIDATISSTSSTLVGQNQWRIFSNSQDQVFVKENGSTILVKTFPIIGGVDNISLVCTFTVTEKGIKLDSVILNSPENRPVI